MSNSILYDIKQVFKNGNYLYQVIIVNVVVFVLLNLLIAMSPNTSYDTIMRFVGLSADVSTYYWRFWTYLTYMFTHTGFNHLFFNMIILYMMGRIFSELYGAKRFLTTYLYGGIFGGVFYVVLTLLFSSLSNDSYLIGASAGAMAVVIAIGFLQPSYMVQIFTFRVELKYVVLAAFILSSVLYLNENQGGKISHFGGALYGYLFARYLPSGLDINELITKFFSGFLKIFNSKKKIKVVHKTKGFQKAKNSKKMQAEIDAILDKISKSGYDSLTKEEKDFLFNYSNKP